MNAFDNGDVRATVLIDVHAIADKTTVRRLTALECEKLQGFPPEWTKYDVDGKEQSDSHRYKQMGNAVAVPVVEWIVKRMVGSGR